ncbi:MAG: hypothetical protein A3J46_05935 [Candidatus Yanofskybacteria bacterium RIFCSPHIGHO2_02_FULL_41_11]|uniref:Uncharacterized protein n=1 Tax=Candidatus Yanofskybacteria bacterium RIFCSPHIGHO2_02_FULL_41_11 TaxID=1802675 RepID=A0A1F8FAN9_9BACT|nr:MAG: hypothetical protein A3J46_05935 [Candidatus Yanofskybacteria bacterium RIFCSPHIGHO2_02_FULL_41_11]
MAKGKSQKYPCERGCGFLVFGGKRRHEEGQCPKKGITGVMGNKQMLDSRQHAPMAATTAPGTVANS